MNTNYFIPQADNKFAVWLKTQINYLSEKYSE
jgi:hypothetical protein